MHYNEPFPVSEAMAAPRERIPSPELEPAALSDPGSQPDPPPPEPGNYPDFSSESSGSRGPSPGPEVPLREHWLSHNEELPYDNETALCSEISRQVSALLYFDDAVNELDRQFKKITKNLNRLRSLALKQVRAGGQIDASIEEATAILETISLEDEQHELRKIVLRARIAALEHAFRTEYELQPYYPELASTETALEQNLTQIERGSELWIRIGKLKEKKLQRELGGEAYARLQANRRWQDEQEQSKAGNGEIKCACCPAAATEGLTSEELLGMVQGI